jgi:TRAP transporter 4TM/12TM fusion protein
MTTAREPVGPIPAAAAAPVTLPGEPDGEISQAQAQQLIEEFESESPTRRVRGAWRWVVGTLAATLSIYALYWTQYNVPTTVYRASFLLVALVLSFLLYPAGGFAGAWHRLVSLLVASVGTYLLLYGSPLSATVQANRLDFVLLAILTLALAVPLLRDRRRNTRKPAALSDPSHRSGERAAGGQPAAPAGGRWGLAAAIAALALYIPYGALTDGTLLGGRIPLLSTIWRYSYWLNFLVLIAVLVRLLNVALAPFADRQWAWRGVAGGLLAGIALVSLYLTPLGASVAQYRAPFLLLGLVVAALLFALDHLRGPARWAAIAAATALAVYGALWVGLSTAARPALLPVLPVGVREAGRFNFVLLTTMVAALLYSLFAAGGGRDRDRVAPTDVVLAALSALSLGFLIHNYEAALQRITRPTPLEVVMGLILIVLVLEATRRTTGWPLMLTAIGFLLYAFFGNLLPAPFGHRGYQLPRIVGQNYLTLDGLFGVPLDVAATFIVLFTIYGAVLEYSGAGKFFIDWSFAALGKSRGGTGPGRTVTAAGFLLGTVSGSGVATTVTLGSLAWPLLRRAGYNRDIAGGLLSAAGIGALLSPPTLGAAAFLIAEYLDVSYLKVLVFATIPTVLYYLSCLLMIEADARRMRTRGVAIETPPLWELTLRYGYHFTSLFVIVLLMAVGLTPFMAVFLSIVVAFALSFIRPETRLTSLRAAAAGATLAAILLVRELLALDRASLGGQNWQQVIGTLAPAVAKASFWGMMLTAAIATALTLMGRARRGRADVSNETSAAGASATGVGVAGAAALSGAEDRRWLQALEAGGKGVLSVAATTAAAGIIVSIVNLTGLGLKLSGIIVDLAGGSKFFTIVFAAIAVWILGLAVPVTASYIIAAVMIVPALAGAPNNPALGVGVPFEAAHMFIFYYAVLADVSPPTALAPFAAAAITGGNPFRTTMLAWKYCLPAFLVPFMFTLSQDGASLLMLGAPATIAQTFVTACLAVAALAIAFGGWFIRQATVVERLLAGAAGLALLYADWRSDLAGLALLALAAGLHLLRVRGAPPAPSPPVGAGAD